MSSRLTSSMSAACIRACSNASTIVSPAASGNCCGKGAPKSNNKKRTALVIILQPKTLAGHPTHWFLGIPAYDKIPSSWQVLPYHRISTEPKFSNTRALISNTNTTQQAANMYAHLPLNATPGKSNKQQKLQAADIPL